MANQYKDLSPAQLEWLRQSYIKQGLTGPSVQRILGDAEAFDAVPANVRANLFRQLNSTVVAQEVKTIERKLASSTIITAQENAEIDAEISRQQYVQKIDQLMTESLAAVAEAKGLYTQSTTTGLINAQPNTLQYVYQVANGNPSETQTFTAVQTSLLVSTAPGGSILSNTPLSGDKQQAVFTAAEYDVRLELLKNQGVTTQDKINIKIESVNGRATISTPDGRSITIPQDEYDTLVRSTVLDAQYVTNYERAYQEWSSSGTGGYEPGSTRSRELFSDYVNSRFEQTGARVVDDPRVGDAGYAKAGTIRQKLTDATTPGTQVDKTAQAVGANDSLQAGPLNADETKRISGEGKTETPSAENSASTPTTASRPLIAGAVNDAQAASNRLPADESSRPSTSVTINAGNGGSNTASVDKNAGTPGAGIRDNPLDSYTSYTYALSLYMMSQNEFNSISKTSGGHPRIKNCLISSAGRGGSSGESRRNANFNENFFFDDLKFTTVVSLNSSSQGTNLIDASFTILEPNGLSLLDRLIATAREVLPDSQNHLSAPYLLQIDFYDAEKGKIPNTTKYMPIRLIECKIKVAGSRGSEYRFKAVPYGHHAIMNTVQSTPANFEVTGKTLEEFFKDSSSNESQVVNTFRESQAAQGSEQRQPTGNAGNPGSRIYQISSYVEAFNAWQTFALSLRDTNQSTGYKNTIQVKFHPDILRSQEIVHPDKMDPLDSAMAVVDAKTGRGLSTPPPNTNLNKIRIRAGTTVTQVINMAMKNSRFIRDQIPDQQYAENINAANALPGKILRWWKVVPSVELRKYDYATEKWYGKITYYVIPYEVRNTTYHLAPMAEIGPMECVKEYNYIYTGKNTNVIDVQIDFDFLYYTSITVYNSKTRKEGDRVNPDAESRPGSESGINGPDSRTNGRHGVNLNTVHLQSDSVGSAAGGKLRNDYKSFVVSNLSDNLYTRPGADMLMVRMKINGDPEFIKQDEIFVSPERIISESFTETVQNLNNSLPMDTREVMVRLVFNVPSDIDDTSGQAVGIATAQSRFTGIYRVLTVENEFKSGKFEQTIEMVRYFNQSADPTRYGVNAVSLNRLQAPETVLALQNSGDLDNAASSTVEDQQLAFDESDADSLDESDATLVAQEDQPFKDQELAILQSIPNVLEEALGILQGTGTTIT
jgi:hypothetical protein